jgi:hypothetical protein
MTELPKVFQDAVSIWVDSLCILRDSQEDWKAESARMADVFANSLMTIAATAAKRPSEGLDISRTGPLTENGHL